MKSNPAAAGEGRSWVFNAATMGGVPVEVSVDIPIRFNLEPMTRVER